MDPSRRTILRSGALGVGLTVAGCLDASPTGSSPGDEDGEDDPNDGDGANGTNGTDDSDSNDDDGTGSSPEITAIETIALEPRTDEPPWASDGIGTVALITDADVLERLDAIATNRTAETVDPFLEETDFETEVLVLVESGGPTICHDSIEVSDVNFDAQESAITATATVVDSSDGGCGEALPTRRRSRGSRSTATGCGTTTPSSRSPMAGEKPKPSRRPTSASSTRSDSRVASSLTAIRRRFRNHSSARTTTSSVSRPPSRYTGATPTRSPCASTLEVARGESVSVTMRNLTSVEQGTGNDRKFSLEVRTEAGWQEVRGHRSEHGIGYTDEGIIHRPGEGFDWELELSEAAVEDLYSGLEVCPGLPAGRYRFVYWPLDLTVAFDVLE
ncbi:hypothetical protein ACFQMM_00695 [Saliphagus sp. GCM10025308]